MHDTSISEDVARLRESLHHCTTEVGRLVVGLDDEAFARADVSKWSPAPWSPAQCVEHVSIVTDLYLPEIRRALQEGREVQDPTKFSVRPSWRIVKQLVNRLIISMQRPGGLKFRAPKKFVPIFETLPSKSALLKRYVDVHQELEKLMEESSALQVDSLYLRSPILPLLRMSVFQAFGLLTAHCQRHLGQLERILAQQAEAPPTSSK